MTAAVQFADNACGIIRFHRLKRLRILVWEIYATPEWAPIPGATGFARRSVLVCMRYRGHGASACQTDVSRHRAARATKKDEKQ
jgi:hypothetical protein